MALKYAVLATLLDGEASGYDLAKRFDISVSNVWHALPQQIYAELGALEKQGLVTGKVVVQESRPNKRLYSLNDSGRAALVEWVAGESRPSAVKDEALVRCFAADLVDPSKLMPGFEVRREHARNKLNHYLEVQRSFLKGRTEEEYVRSARRVGPYLALKRGLIFEQENLAWIDWVLEILRQRAEAGAGARPSAS
ncbi:MAG: PadR family transcriptional regulator [Dehalococcoidia bacterium]|nr:PadR family transcriptional regulator [Dehalococcoidia bacterium]